MCSQNAYKIEESMTDWMTHEHPANPDRDAQCPVVAAAHCMVVPDRVPGGASCPLGMPSGQQALPTGAHCTVMPRGACCLIVYSAT